MSRWGRSMKSCLLQGLRPCWMTAVWLGAVFALAGGSIAIGQVSSDRPVVLRRRVSADYRENPQTLAFTAETAPHASVQIRTGDTVSGLISRYYSLGPRNGRQAYAAMLDHVEQLNGIGPETVLKPGSTVALPVVPPISVPHPNVANHLNMVPKLSLDPELLGKEGEIIGYSEAPRLGSKRISEAGRRKAQEVVQLDRVTAAKGSELIASDRSYDVVSAPAVLKLADAAGPAASESLPQAELDLIRTKLAPAAKQRPVLLVFDDGWIDPARSQAFLVSALGQIWKKLKLGQPKFGPSLLGPPPNATISGHALEISQALAPLQALEPPEGRVEVIYLPITRRDPVAEEVLVQLVALDLIVEHMRGSLGDTPPPDLAPRYYATARQIVAATGPTVEESDVAVLRAALYFGSYLSNPMVADRPVFTNFSWTVFSGEFRPSFPEDAYRSVLVEAAGNDGGDGPDDPPGTIYQPRRDFVYRSLSPADVLAVMNIRNDGARDCGSATFGTITTQFAVAYPGRVSANVCGTSFSAPRVAWILAAREAMRPPGLDSRPLYVRLREELPTIRDQAAVGHNRERLQPQRLFGP